ncbi:MAG: SMI1/KNR4 family protein [Clostridium baratii]|uniref:hypothetical protein n=1 Tax=Clostridium baratii TaxID=1561 RepID=UPI00242FCE77|nr:hypothetical protein [Clostridium baratii]MBS6005911.1 SMI1/KNR4 family protein [Clostridium baratii]MDU1052977.1 hypothetical protein [Clostridium baratii]
MYNELINMLKLKGVKFEKGLSEEEIIRITQEYSIEFPEELREFYMTAVPVSRGFYNWRNFDPKNIQYIKAAIYRPINNIYELANEVYWCDEWGNEPSEEHKRVEVIRELLKKAPKLIPIYAHRYMPEMNVENAPIFSIHDTDIICYGENLFSYFEIEFGEKKQIDIDYNIITYIPVWIDFL